MKQFLRLLCLSITILIFTTQVIAQPCLDGSFQQWNAAYGAFRFGKFNPPLDNADSMGCFSFSYGFDVKAKGSYSFAGGAGSKATGPGSFAFGSGANAQGPSSIAIGSCDAVGENSTSIGFRTKAYGSYSVSLGYKGLASGYNSTVIGSLNSGSGSYSTAIGLSNIANSYNDFAIGAYNDTNTLGSSISVNPFNRIFQIGNGENGTNRSNAMTVLHNGNVGIGVLNPAQRLEVSGNITVQNGKGLIRSNDGTQKKIVTTIVTVNTTLTGGSTTSISFSFPEGFTAVPDVYIGNVTGGAGGWAEVTMSIAEVSLTGGKLYVHNPRTVTWSPNFTIKVIAIGAQ